MNTYEIYLDMTADADFHTTQLSHVMQAIERVEKGRNTAYRGEMLKWSLMELYSEYEALIMICAADRESVMAARQEYHDDWLDFMAAN